MDYNINKTIDAIIVYNIYKLYHISTLLLLYLNQ